MKFYGEQPVESNTAAELLRQIAHLMELNGDNVFKVRAFTKAADHLEGREDLKVIAQQGRLLEFEGVGKGIAEVLSEFLLNEKVPLRDSLISALPKGLLEIAELPGLGPKKARALIESLGVQSIEDLENACRLGRVQEVPGFGVKQQTKLMEALKQRAKNAGRHRLGDVLEFADKIRGELLQILQREAEMGKKRASKSEPQQQGAPLLSEVGGLGRFQETLTELEFLVGRERSAADRVDGLLESVAKRASKEASVPVRIHFCEPSVFGLKQLHLTASEDHWRALAIQAGSTAEKFEGDCLKKGVTTRESEIYSMIGLEFVPPEMRETGEELKLAAQRKLGSLVQWDSVRGILHNHTVASDGRATLEEMAQGASRLGYEYLGISEHSQSAFYANGLKKEDLRKQQLEIKRVQALFPKLKIFWGIESDILADGSLDYPEETLENFDFVVASIHSRLKMGPEQMTERLLRAIQNPFATILGHPTGRLLLEREESQFDFERIIEAAAKAGVAIELNANPQRLDIDWRLGPLLRKYQTLVCINPDAHSVQGLEDTRLGVAMARKALLPKAQILNSLGTDEIAQFLKARRNHAMRLR